MKSIPHYVIVFHSFGFYRLGIEMHIHLLLLFFISLMSAHTVLAQTHSQKDKALCTAFYSQKNRVTKNIKKNTKIATAKENDEFVVNKLSADDFMRFAKYTNDVTYPSYVKFAVEVNENGTFSKEILVSAEPSRNIRVVGLIC